MFFFFFFQAEDGIRDSSVTGVQTCALPIWRMVEGDHSGLLESESVNGRVVSPGARHLLIHVADWYFWIVLSAAAIGFIGLLRSSRRRPSGVLLATALFFLLLLPIELWGNVRFHIPALPFAALAACAAPLVLRPPEEAR